MLDDGVAWLPFLIVTGVLAVMATITVSLVRAFVLFVCSGHSCAQKRA